MRQKQDQLQKLREKLLGLITTHPNSPEAEKWKQMLAEIGMRKSVGSRWPRIIPVIDTVTTVLKPTKQKYVSSQCQYSTNDVEYVNFKLILLCNTLMPAPCYKNEPNLHICAATSYTVGEQWDSRQWGVIMLTDAEWCDCSTFLLRCCLGRHQRLCGGEEGAPGRVQQESGHLPNYSAAAWPVALREGADDERPWTSLY